MFSEIKEGVSIVPQNKSIRLAASRSCVEYSFEVKLNSVKRKRFQKFALWLNVCCKPTTLFVAVDKEKMWTHGTEWKLNPANGSSWQKYWRTFVLTPGMHTIRFGQIKTSREIQVKQIWLTDQRRAIPPMDG